MLMRFDPFREIDRVFEQALSSARPATIPMDAYRHGDSCVVHLDLPGVDPSSIDITVERQLVTIQAERHWEAVEGDQVLANERRQGKFTRQLMLGDGLSLDAVHASYENGVLTLTIPISEKAKPRRVELSSAASAEPAAIAANAR